MLLPRGASRLKRNLLIALLVLFAAGLRSHNLFSLQLEQAIGVSFAVDRDEAARRARAFVAHTLLHASPTASECRMSVE